MAKNIAQTYRANTRKKRKGVHSKNASKVKIATKKSIKGKANKGK